MKFSFATFVVIISAPLASANTLLFSDLPALNVNLDDNVITIQNRQVSYNSASQDNTPISDHMALVSDDGSSFNMVGNMWRALEFPERLTPHALGDFVVSFDFDLEEAAEVHGICFEENLLFGNQDNPADSQPKRCLSPAYFQEKPNVLDVILTKHQTRAGESRRYVLNLSKLFDRLDHGNGAATYAPTAAPTAPALALARVGNNGSPAESFPLGRCQGDCDSDAECGDGLVCMQRSGGEAVEGCLGEDAGGDDYCYGRLGPSQLWNAGNNGSPAGAFPLGECEGDCDGDGDCGEGLVCFQRGGFDPVPGCDGDGKSGWDYCVDVYKPDIKYLAFINDNDVDGSVGNSTFRNVAIATSLASCLSGEDFGFTLSDCTSANFLEKVRDLMAATASCIDAGRTDPLLELFSIFDATQETDVYDNIAEICTESYKTSRYDFADNTLGDDEGTERQMVKEFIDGGTVWNYQDDAASAVNILKTDGKFSTSRLLSYPEHHALDDCEVGAAMCCFVASRTGPDPVDKNSDVCYVDMKASHRTAHVKDGYSIYGDSATDNNVYCEGFAWEENDGGSMSSALRGNALFKVGFMDNLVSNGSVEQVPGTPLCGCVDRMPVVTEAACTDVTDATAVVDVSFDSSTGEFDATYTMGSIEYGNCGGMNLVDHYESLVGAGKARATDASYLRERIVGDGNCTVAIGDFLSGKGLVVG